MVLSRQHGYFYQIQTQMHITRLQWCDFVIWSPIQEPFVQRVKYDVSFMNHEECSCESLYFLLLEIFTISTIVYADHTR